MRETVKVTCNSLKRRIVILEDAMMSLAFILRIIALILGLLTFVTFIYGLVSWCLIKEFRSFRNHVLLSAVLASLLRFLAIHLQPFAMVYMKEYMDMDMFGVVISHAAILFFALAFHCWIAVFCYILYVDYVKVFHLDFNGKYLITNLFAWCISLVEISGFVITYLLLGSDGFFKLSVLYVFLIPTLVGLVNYLAAVYSVFFGRKTEVWTSGKKWGHFGLSTLIFLVSNLFVLVHVCREITLGESLIYVVVGVVVESLIALLVLIYFICVKSNRTLWREYLNKSPVESPRAI